MLAHIICPIRIIPHYVMHVEVVLGCGQVTKAEKVLLVLIHE